MPSYLSTAVRAVWSKLKAGANVAPVMAARKGHYYEEAEGSKKPIRITRSDCPAIVMWPGVSGIAIQPATNVTFDVRLPLNFEIHVEEKDVDTLLDLYEAVLRDLHAAWRADNFGLAAAIGCYVTEPGQAQVSKVYDEEADVMVSWRCSFTYTLVFRRRIESP